MPVSPLDLIAAGPNATPADVGSKSNFQPLPTSGESSDSAHSSTAANSFTNPPDDPAPETGATDDSGANDKGTAPNVAEGDENSNDVLKKFDKLFSEPVVPENKTFKKSDSNEPDKTTTTPKDSQSKPTNKEVDEAKARAGDTPPTAQVEADDSNTQRPVVVDFTKEIPTDISKKMSKEALAWTAAQLKRAKEFETETAKLKEQLKGTEEGALPKQWFEHPEAYELLPEYKQSAAVVQDVSSILEHYRVQLLRSREGEKWQDIIIQKDGSRKYALREPSEEANLLLEERIATAREWVKTEQSNVDYIRQNFTHLHKQNLATLRQFEDRYFPKYVKEIKSDSPIVNQYVDVVRQDLVKLGQGENPLGQTLLKLYAFAMEQVQENQKLKKVSGAATTLNQAQRRAGPTESTVNGGSPTNKSIDPDDAPFDPKMWPTT